MNLRGLLPIFFRAFGPRTLPRTGEKRHLKGAITQNLKRAPDPVPTVKKHDQGGSIFVQGPDGDPGSSDGGTPDSSAETALDQKNLRIRGPECDQDRTRAERGPTQTKGGHGGTR